MVLGKNHVIKKFELCDFPVIYEWHMKEKEKKKQKSTEVDIAIPEVFVGGLLGSRHIFLFSAWACFAVGRTAQKVVNEVTRQFIERPGIMEYKEKPDYGCCVAIVASASLREMIKPDALAILSPVVTGFLF